MVPVHLTEEHLHEAHVGFKGGSGCIEVSHVGVQDTFLATSDSSKALAGHVAVMTVDEDLSSYHGLSALLSSTTQWGVDILNTEGGFHRRDCDFLRLE